MALRCLAVAACVAMFAGTCIACPNPSVASVAVSPGSIISFTMSPTGYATATVTLSCTPDPGTIANVAVSDDSGGVLVGVQGVSIYGQDYGTFQFWAGQVPQTTTFTITATLQGSASGTVTVVPLTPTLAVSASNLIALSTQKIATFTLSVNGYVEGHGFTGGVIFNLSQNPTGGHLSSPASTEVINGSNAVQFTATADSQINATTSYTFTATSQYGGPSAQASVTVTPLTPTVSVDPGSIVGGSGQVATFSVTLNAPFSPPYFVSDNYSSSDNSAGILSGLGGVGFEPGEQGPKYFTATAQAVVQTQTFTVTVISTSFGGPSASVGISVTPSLPPENGSNEGPPECKLGCGNPINLSNGNTVLQQRDYSLPGLGGGLELSRTWNSLESSLGAPSNSGAFGLNWRSTYEEQLTFPDSSTAKYWRSDGSAWAFAYNSSTQVYSLASPPDQRVSMVFNTGTNQFVMTFADGSQRLFTQPGLLAAIVDRNGNQVTLAYDGSNRLTQATDAAGRALTFNRGNATFPNLVSSLQDAAGVIAQYTYDSNQNLTQAVYADGSAVNLAYDSTSKMLLSVTDAQGKLLESHTYDSSNRGLTSTRANGADQVTVTYAAQGTTSLSDSMGRTTTYGWQTISGHNVVNAVTGPGCATCGGRGNQSLTYDGLGNVSSSTDALGRVTNFTYDANGNVLTRSIQLDGSTTLTWSYTYNQFQEVLTAADPMGNVTANTYDAKGNLLSTTTPPPSGSGAGLTTNFAYDAKGELTQVTDPKGSSTAIAYNAAGLIASVTDAQGHATSFTYDARGNRTSSTDALSNVTTFAYDVMNRLTAITQPGNVTTTFGYDTRGRRSSVTDANNKTTAYSYDDADRLLSVTDAASNSTIYGYDTENHLQAITDALGRVTSFAYDPLGRVTGVTFPSTFTESYTYDAVGNLLSKTDRKGQTISYSYDNLDRLKSKTYPDSTSVAYSYDFDSRLTQASDSSGTYSFSYDNLGRLLGTTTNYSFLGGRTLTNSYTYDAASNRASFTDPEGGITNYTYDTLNRLTSLTDSNTGTFGLAYDALGRRTNLTRPNGVGTSYSYDNLSRLLQVLHAKGSQLRESAAYTYDPAGNRLSRTESTPGKGTAINQDVTNYSYDAIYELTQAVENGATSESYTYDAVGNRLSAPNSSPWNYNSSNELLSTPSATYTYDRNGNVLTRTDSSGTARYAWDFENRLTSAVVPLGTGSATASFKYDPFGRRIEKVSGLFGTTTIYVYDGDNIVEELDGSGNVQARFTQGLGIDEPLAMTSSGVTSYYHADGLGSIVIRTGSSGSAVDGYGYDSFGNVTGKTSTVLKGEFYYTGREFDQDIGLYYYRARYYDSFLGRFLSEDPLMFIAGNPNFYSYVANSPVNSVDPRGTDKTSWDNWGSPNGRTPLDGPRNGNWGGKNWSGGWNANQHGGKDGPGAPTDSGDDCYMAHDRCYQSACSSKDKKDKKDCDAKLVQCLKQLPKNPKQWPRPPRAGTEADSDSFRNWAIWYFSH